MRNVPPSWYMVVSPVSQDRPLYAYRDRGGFKFNTISVKERAGFATKPSFS